MTRRSLSTRDKRPALVDIFVDAMIEETCGNQMRRRDKYQAQYHGGSASTCYRYQNGVVIYHGDRLTSSYCRVDPSSPVKKCEACGNFKKENMLRHHYPYVPCDVKSKGQYEKDQTWEEYYKYRKTSIVCLSCLNKLNAVDRRVNDIRANIKLMEQIHVEARNQRKNPDIRPVEDLSRGYIDWFEKWAHGA